MFDLLKIDLIRDGKIIQNVQNIMRPEKYTLKSGTDSLEICFQSSRIIRFRSTNIGFRLTTTLPVQYMPINPKQARMVYPWPNYHKFIITLLKGDQKLNEKKPDGNQSNYNTGMFLDFPAQKNEIVEIVLEEYISEWEPVTYDKKFDKCVADASESYGGFLNKMPAVPTEFMQTGKEAVYLNWASTVEPRGFIARDAILMSKNWMSYVWSWDHCFNAIAMSYINPEFA